MLAAFVHRALFQSGAQVGAFPRGKQAAGKNGHLAFEHFLQIANVHSVRADRKRVVRMVKAVASLVGLD